MAESQIAGLFMTPEMYQRQQMQADRQRAAEYAQLAPEQRAAMGFFSAGQGIGRAAGTLLGAQDPQLQRITEQQKMLQGLDVADPDSLMQAARQASQAGNVPLAMQLAGRAQEVAASLATVQKAELSLRQERALRDELNNLPADATDEQRIAVLSKYGPPGQMLQALLTRVNQRENREARAEETRQRIEERRQNLELQLENRLQIARERGADQRTIAQMQIDGRAENARIMAELRRELASAGGAGSGGTPYFQPVQTAQGVFAFNARTGRVEPVTGPDGAPIVGASADPTLQGDIAGARAGATVTARSGAEAAMNAPRVITQGEDTIRLVDDLLKSPGFSQAVGSSRLAQLQRVPGTPARDFDIRLEQLKGQQFLQAYETLKGGGHITEVEGKKATDALSRMDASSTEREFINAAREFQAAIRVGIERAKKAQGQGQQPALAPKPPAPPPAPKVGEVRNGYRFNGGNPALPASWTKQ